MNWKCKIFGHKFHEYNMSWSPVKRRLCKRCNKRELFLLNSWWSDKLKEAVDLERTLCGIKRETESKFYTVVFHTWFMESRGFSIVTIEARNERECKCIAYEMIRKKQDSFNRMAFVIVGEQHD